MKTQARRKSPLQDVKILYARAAGRCAFPSCRAELILPETKTDKTKQIGEIAHILAHSPQGPRGIVTYDHAPLNCYENWILLCPTHHKKIDKQPNNYSATRLRQLKSEHESWVNSMLDEGMSEVGFAELDLVSKAIMSKSDFGFSNFNIIPITEKIQKNALTQRSHELIRMGFINISQVTEFITQMAQLDSHYPERLKNGFKLKYNELRKNLRDDALFEAMFDFTKLGSHDFRRQSAGLAVLCYFFEICEIFEI